MKDLNVFTHSFQEWSAVFDFLANIKDSKEIVGVEIAKQDDNEWMMNVKMAGKNCAKRNLSPAALYDLYW